MKRQGQNCFHRQSQHQHEQQNRGGAHPHSRFHGICPLHSWIARRAPDDLSLDATEPN